MRGVLGLVVVAACGDHVAITDGNVDEPAPHGDAGSCPTGGYSTSFALTENPISEGGVWAAGGASTGLDWSNVQTNGAIAFGTLTGFDGYNDSIALLSSCAADQRVSAVIHLAPGATATATHEVELILRGSYTPHVQHLYECNLGYADASGTFYAQIMRMDGMIGVFTEVDNGGSAPAVVDGAVFSAEIVGSTIRTYLNGTLLRTATDATYATGQPGIGFFWRGTETLTDFAFSHVTIENAN